MTAPVTTPHPDLGRRLGSRPINGLAFQVGHEPTHSKFDVDRLQLIGLTGEGA